MYLPSHFEESDPQALHALIRDYPLGLLVSHGEAGLDANHLPFELSPEKGAQGTLEAHVARNNPVWSELRDGDEVLVVFRAGDAYISPQWYPSKQEHHRQVPTWNYRVVHAHGRVRIRDDERYVRGLVARLTRTHEATQETPWKMTDGRRLHRRDAPADRRHRNRDHPPGRQVQAQPEQGSPRYPRASAALLARGEQAIGAAMDDCAARRDG